MKAVIVECPRDAMQGLKNFIPTSVKIMYINALIDCNFDVLDCGSFVSARAIPQLSDTKEVLNALKPKGKTKFLVIVANKRGAKTAASAPKVDCIGFPLSVSETFQQRNTNKSIEQALQELADIKLIADMQGKETVAYISMCFGNPYKDLWNLEIVQHWVQKVAALGISTISLSDTIGIANPTDVFDLFTAMHKQHPSIVFGAHFHTNPSNWEAIVSAAFDAGCRRFDGAIHGLGGCPMAFDSLTGNLPTENLIHFLENKQVDLSVDMNAFDKARSLANQVF